MVCAPSEDSDQPGHPPSLIGVFTVRLKKAWFLSHPLSTQQWLWSDWADAQADPSLRWVQSSLCWFCHEAAHLWRSKSCEPLLIFYDVSSPVALKLVLMTPGFLFIASSTRHRWGWECWTKRWTVWKTRANRLVSQVVTVSCRNLPVTIKIDHLLCQQDLLAITASIDNQVLSYSPEKIVRYHLHGRKIILALGQI